MTETTQDVNKSSAELDPDPQVPPMEPFTSSLTETLPPLSEPYKAQSPPKMSSEIEEGKIKNALKEIISEIDNYAEKDDGLKENKTETVENVASTEAEAVNNVVPDYSSEAYRVNIIVIILNVINFVTY